MKKIIILFSISVMMLTSISVLAGEDIDKKSMDLAIKKTSELKTQLNLDKSQQESVKEILYVSFRDLRLAKENSELEKDQKISLYDQINEMAHKEMKKVLSDEQYRRFIKPNRGE